MIKWKDVKSLLIMYFCYICLFYDAMGQGVEHDNTENNADFAEMWYFTNFLNMQWQNKTKSSANKTGLAIHNDPIFIFSLCHPCRF